jgi:SAM-dependent methyltransferase
MPSGVDRRELWSEIAAIYDATRSFPDGGDAAVAAVLVRELRTRGAGRVLDLGCGTGRCAAPLAAAGLDVVGIDRTPEMLAAIARKPGGSTVRVVRGDAGALPFARAFDAVVMSHFLHLQPSLEPIVRELRGVLRAGAVLVTIDPGFLPRPLGERVTTLAVTHLTGQAPAIAHGDATREHRLLEALARGVGAGPVEAVLAFETVLMRTAREHLNGVRNRVWSTYRVHDPADTTAAADAAERTLVAEGVDLDAPEREKLGVRLLIATLPR